jgi:hypothetical protein
LTIIAFARPEGPMSKRRRTGVSLSTEVLSSSWPSNIRFTARSLLTGTTCHIKEEKEQAGGHLLFDTAYGVREEKEEIEDQERLRHDSFEDSASK